MPQGIQPILEIEKLSSSGEGIARNQGLVYFIPRTLPGEKCVVRPVLSKKKWCRALPVKWLQYSGDRTKPPCSYYDKCGGCQLQHISYEDQLVFKKHALEETLRRIGHIEQEAEAVHPSRPFGYRRKVTFEVRFTSAGEPELCFHRWDTPRDLVAIGQCPQLVPALNDSLPPLLVWISRISWKNAIQKAVLVSDEEGVKVILRLKQPKAAMEKSSETIALPEGIEAVYISKDREHAPLKKLLSGSSQGFPPGSFRQINAEAAAFLYRQVVHFLPEACSSVVDAYGGSGELAVMLLEQCGKVTLIELDSQTVRQARRRSSGRKLLVRQGRVEDLLPKALPAEYVILDPPRAGCSQPVIKTLQEFSPSRIAYISCHPAALARDLRSLMDHGYRISRVQPVDMFPQTYHLETLVLLETP